MDYKKISKGIEHFITWLIVYICSLIIKFTPQRCLYLIARLLGNLGYLLAGKQRKIALNSLSLAFGKEKTPEQIKKIAQDCFIFMTKSGLEIMFYSDKPDLVKKQVRISHKERLDKAFSRGKGVILVTAHFGNFPLTVARLSLEGYKSGAIMRPMRNTMVDDFFTQKRRKYQVNIIYSLPRRDCVEKTLHSLRNNESILVLLDQNFGTNGVFVDFFGIKAATAIGPIVLARRTGAAIVPCFIIRQPDDTHDIIIEEQLELVEGKNEEDTAVINIQKITNIFEAYIRRYPAEWGWIHRRWKSRPKAESGLG